MERVVAGMEKGPTENLRKDTRQRGGTLRHPLSCPGNTHSIVASTKRRMNIVRGIWFEVGVSRGG